MSTKKTASTGRGSTAKAPAKTTSDSTYSSSNKNNSTGISEEHKQMPFHKLFINMLKDMYWAEQHLIGALGEMQEAATSEELKEAFEDHQYQTRKHISRLEKVFSLLEEKASAKKCEAMEGLTKEAKSMISETKEGTMTRDAALIIAAQKIEHYEIASYGSLVQVALTMEHNEVADILEKTLWEEEDTDKLLTQVAESYVNPMADDEYARTGQAQEKEQEMEEA